MPFGSGPQYTAYANYTIYFSDETEYQAAKAIVGGDFYNIAPETAAGIFGMDWPPVGGPMDNPKGLFSIYPYTFDSPEIGHPLPSGVFLSPSVDSVLVPGQAGIPASIWPAGPAMNLVWSGLLMKSNGDAGSEEFESLTISPRRWINGFELAMGAEGGTGSGTVSCRDSSRVTDGFGLAVRRWNNLKVNHTNTEYEALANERLSWERFYIRLRKIDPAVPNIVIWRSQNTLSSTSGVAIGFTTLGELELFNVELGVFTSKRITPPLTLDKWYKIDIMLTQAPPVTFTPSPLYWPGKAELFLNGVLYDFSEIIVGIGQENSHHQGSDLGQSASVANLWEYDLDDWIGADYPASTVDVLAGSHVKKTYVDSLGIDHAGFAGQSESMNQMMNPAAVTSGSRFTSTTPSAIINGVTNENVEQDSTGINIGAAAIVVGTYGLETGANNGAIGYSIGGGAANLTEETPLTGLNFESTLYKPTTLADVSPLDVYLQKSISTNLSTIYGLQACVEHIGVWGEEDDSSLTIPKVIILHNCNYANTPWAFVGPAPDGPVAFQSDVYVGNGTQQAIDLPLPCHFLWIRAIGASTPPVIWYGAGIGGHLGGADAVVPDTIVRVFTDATGQTKFTVVGTNPSTNASGVSYQYIAFCDPGMRFNLCGAFKHHSTDAAGLNTLIDSNFIPDGGFVQNEVQSVSANDALTYKGPGFTGTEGKLLNAAVVANYGTFAQGLFTSGLSSHYATSSQCNYSLWRLSDGNPGVVVQMFSYVGNGVNPRVIPCTPISERFPLFVLVMPHNGTSSVYRDPSHTGVTSQVFTGAENVSTGIVDGGIDTITVHSALNGNGVIYDVFIIPGFDDGWYNGAGGPPNGPGGPHVDLPPFVPSDISLIPSGGIVFGGAASTLILKDKSGIYTLIKDKTEDTLYDRQTGIDNADVKIPNPIAKTGFIGG